MDTDKKDVDIEVLEEQEEPRDPDLITKGWCSVRISNALRGAGYARISVVRAALLDGTLRVSKGGWSGKRGAVKNFGKGGIDKLRAFLGLPTIDRERRGIDNAIALLRRKGYTVTQSPGS